MKEASVFLKDVFDNVVMTITRTASEDKDKANAILAAFECGFAYDFPKEYAEYRKKANAVLAKHLPDLVKWTEAKAGKTFGGKFTPEQLAERVASGIFADATKAAVVCATLFSSSGDVYGTFRKELAEAYGDKARADAETDASLKETSKLFTDALTSVSERPAPMSQVCFSVACATLNADPDRIKTLAGDGSGGYSSMDASSFDVARAMLLPAMCVRAVIVAGVWALDGTVTKRRAYMMVSSSLAELMDEYKGGSAIPSLFGLPASMLPDVVKRAQFRDFVMKAGHASGGDSSDVLSFLSSIPKKPSEVSGDAAKALMLQFAKTKDFKGNDVLAKLAETGEGKTAQEFLVSVLSKIKDLPGEENDGSSERAKAIYALNWLLAYRYFEDESVLLDFASECFKDLGSQVLSRVAVIAASGDDEGDEEGDDGEGFKS